MTVFSVTQFVEFVNAAFSSAVFPEGVGVEGEVVEFRVSQDKWVWFSLKDKGALVSCFSTVWQLRQPLEDGMHVRVFGSPKVYPKSGKFSVVVERVEFVGEGALRRAFELLKKKLGDEGIFAPERKRPIPRFPERIGLIASAESAAYSDFLRIIGDRWGGVTVQANDVAVQGKDAISQIVAAFAHFNAFPELADVLVLTRGGGSLEDLQAFNSEEVCRAVFSSRIPVVVGVGHERDETLADLAADVRASTPSNAAERCVPDRREMAAAIAAASGRMSSALLSSVRRRASEVQRIADRIESYAGMQAAAFTHRLRDLAGAFASFAALVTAMQASFDVAAKRLAANVLFWTKRRQSAVEGAERLLSNVDPRRLLGRGYAIVKSSRGVVSDSRNVDIGERLDVQFGKGGISADVTARTP